MGADDEIEQIMYELSRIQKNKATEHYIGNLKARLAKLKARDTSKKAGGGAYAVKKQGDATIALVGFPSVGKSTLLNALTSAHSKTAGYDFTTLKPIPGMLEYNKTKLQLIDAPGIIEGASEGKGMGRQIISVIRNADLILILLDPMKKRLQIIEDELYESGVRLNMSPPNILIKRTVKGGLVIESTVKQELSEETIIGVLREFGYINAQVLIKEVLTIDRLIDALSTNRVYVPSIIAFNKADALSKNELNKLQKKHPMALFVSAQNKTGLDELVKAMWLALGFKRIYLKRPGMEPDYDEPLVMRGYVTVESVIKKLRKDYTSGKVWGKSVRHPGQIVSIRHELLDEDILTLT